MNFMLVAGAIAAVAFLFAYIRTGRFASTVLALGAGYLLALLWAVTLISYEVVQLTFLSWHEVVYLGLILVPGLLALLFSHKQHSILPRLVAALMIAVLAVTLLLPLFVADTQSGFAYENLQRYREVIIGGFIALGLVDMVLSRSPKAPKHKGH